MIKKKCDIRNRDDSELLCFCRVFYQLSYSDEYTVCCVYNIFIIVSTTLILWEIHLINCCFLLDIVR